MNLKSAISIQQNPRWPGMFRHFQEVYFDSSEDSDCEDGRGPKRKHVRIENTDASMPNETISESENMEVGSKRISLSKHLFLYYTLIPILFIS